MNKGDFNANESTVNRLVFHNSIDVEFDVEPMSILDLIELDGGDYPPEEHETMVELLTSKVENDKNKRYSKKVLKNLLKDPDNSDYRKAAVIENYKEKGARRRFEHVQVFKLYRTLYTEIRIKRDCVLSDKSIEAAILFRFGQCADWKGWKEERQVQRNLADFRNKYKMR